MSVSLWPQHNLSSLTNNTFNANYPSHVSSLPQYLHQTQYGLARSPTTINNSYFASGSYQQQQQQPASAPLASHSFDFNQNLKTGLATSASLNNLSAWGNARGALPAGLNHDPNPLVIRKKSEPVSYNQQIGVRFIKPEPLPPHGDIVVKHLPDRELPAPPPRYIRNTPPAPLDPPPRIIRERPPAPPPCLPDEIVTIPGRRIQAPRKIIIENYAEVPMPCTDCRVAFDTPRFFAHPSEAICF